jgi:hypothetical protein
MPAKVFVIERMASLLLASSNEFEVATFPTSTLSSYFGHLPNSLLSSLDLLKSQAVQGHPLLLNAFHHIQREILNEDSAISSQQWWLSRNLELGVGHAPSSGYERWGASLPATLKKQEKVGLGWLVRRLLG